MSCINLRVVIIKLDLDGFYFYVNLYFYEDLNFSEKTSDVGDVEYIDFIRHFRGFGLY